MEMLVSELNNKNEIAKFDESLAILNWQNSQAHLFCSDKYKLGYFLGQEYQENNVYVLFLGSLYNKDDFSSEYEPKIIYDIYQEEGVMGFKNLNGAFVFTIIDEDEIWIFRDQIGLKPFFYSLNPFVASTSINGILKLKDIHKVKIEGVRELLGLGPSHTLSKTIYDQVLELEPGQYLHCFDNNIEVNKFFDLEFERLDKTYEEVKQDVKDLVIDAIEREYKNGDVSLLSGGLDSSIVTGVLASHLGLKKTFSVDYEENKKKFVKSGLLVSNDQDYIKYVTDKYMIDGNNITISSVQLADSLGLAVELRDAPGMADIDSSLLCLLNRVSLFSKGVFSGECSDEIFGGYPWYYNGERIDSFPWLRSVSERELILKKEIRDKLRLSDYVKEKYSELVNKVPLPSCASEEEIKERTLYYLHIKSFMPTLVDRGSMMAKYSGITLKTPFADPRLISYLYNVPFSYKFRNNQEKNLLREAFESYLPDEVLNRKKSPYPKVTGHDYTRKVVEMVKEALEDKESILHVLFDHKKINELLNSYGSSYKMPWFGQLMMGPQLIAYLYQIHYWGKKYKIELEI